jgi:hypothetical protein
VSTGRGDGLEERLSTSDERRLGPDKHQVRQCITTKVSERSRDTKKQVREETSMSE